MGRFIADFKVAAVSQLLPGPAKASRYCNVVHKPDRCGPNHVNNQLSWREVDDVVQGGPNLED